MPPAGGRWDKPALRHSRYSSKAQPGKARLSQGCDLQSWSKAKFKSCFSRVKRPNFTMALLALNEIKVTQESIMHNYSIPSVSEEGAG